MILSQDTIPWSISCVFASVPGANGSAYVISPPINKNIPIIPIRGMRKDVFIFLNI